MGDLIRLPPVDLGATDPEPNEVFALTFVREGACFRSLLVDTVLLRLIHNEEWETTIPTLADARPYIFRKLSIGGTACLALLMNHTIAGKVGGVTCSSPPPHAVWPRRRVSG